MHWANLFHTPCLFANVTQIADKENRFDDAMQQLKEFQKRCVVSFIGDEHGFTKIWLDRAWFTFIAFLEASYQEH